MVLKKILWIAVPLLIMLGGLKPLFVENNSPLRMVASIPLQNEGRVKSFETFARETLRFISGKDSFERQPAALFLMRHLADPEQFLNIALIRVDHLELKKMLALSIEEKFFSFKKLSVAFPQISMLAQSAQEKRNKDLRPTGVELKAEELYGRLVSVQRLASGELLCFIPGGVNQPWSSPYGSLNPLAAQFQVLASAAAKEDWNHFAQQQKIWLGEVNQLSNEARQAKIKQEIFYYRLNPFFNAAILYLLAFFLFFFSSKAELRLSGLVATGAGLFFHSMGLALRVIILARPPVSNMFESLIFMNWVLVCCALGIFVFNKRYFLLSTATIVSALVMLFAQFLPIDQTLGVLAPVLKSNYWLMIHVLTIVSSYGVLGLAMAVGHQHLFNDAMKRFQRSEEEISAGIINRLLQVGLILLGIGTVLGGVWANESWGRFWGWDPKETWSLITFLGYLVVIHLRQARKLGNFGLASSAIIGFVLVLMTWYGVNFLLGRGLHSYGSGAGGIGWIIGYLIFEGCFFAFVLSKKTIKPRAIF